MGMLVNVGTIDGTELYWTNTWGTMLKSSCLKGMNGDEANRLGIWCEEHDKELELLSTYLWHGFDRSVFDRNKLTIIANSDIIPEDIRSEAQYWIDNYDLPQKDVAIKPSTKKQQSYVYLLKNSAGLHKIGISSDPKRRTSELVNASGLDVHLVRSRLVDDARKLECRLHSCFTDVRKNGEWFDLDDSRLTKLLAIFDNEEDYIAISRT